MDLGDLKPGLSLHFDAALPAGSGQVQQGEHAQSHGASGKIVATPTQEWSQLKRLLNLPDRAANIQPKSFAVSYVPYVDGRIHYHEGNNAVISGEFSGCLMAAYEAKGKRRVAHIPKSHSADADCIGEFRDYFAAHSSLPADKKAKHVKAGHVLKHYFQPFVGSRDQGVQATVIQKLLQAQIITTFTSQFQTFGLMTARGNDCISIWLAKPNTQPAKGQMWHVLMVRKRAPVMDFKALTGKTNRAA